MEGGNRTSQLGHLNWRAVAGVRGDIGSSAWSYDFYGLNSDVGSPQTYVNDLSVSRMRDALDVVGDPGDPSTWRCRSGNPGCVPWNLFTLGARDPGGHRATSRRRSSSIPGPTASSSA